MSVFIVDNDMRIREALSEPLGSHGIARHELAGSNPADPRPSRWRG